PLARRLALDLDELRAVGHWIEQDDEIARQLHRQYRLFARRELHRLYRKRGEAVPQGFRQVDARAPEDLAVVFHFGQRIGTVGSDAAHTRAYGEGALHHPVGDRLVARSAQPARIFLAIEGLERRAGIEHAAAAGTEHV